MRVVLILFFLSAKNLIHEIKKIEYKTMNILDIFRNKKPNGEQEIEVTVEIPKVSKKGKNSVQLFILMELEQMLKKAIEAQLPFPQRTDLPIPKQVQDLIDAGFENTRIVQEFREKQRTLEKEYNQKYENWSAGFEERMRCKNALKCLLQARNVYGEDTLLLPYDQFKKLCERWNLTAGSFDCYAGDIPEDKLQEIIKLKKISSREVPLIELRYVKEFSSDIALDHGSFAGEVRAVRDKLLKFPFVRETHVMNWEYITSNLGKNRTTYVTFFDGTKDDSCFYDVICSEPSKFFITAPKNMMGEGLRVTISPRAKEDPFICAATEYGILIFTRWGEEATAEIIQRHEAFSKMLTEAGL